MLATVAQLWSTYGQEICTVVGGCLGYAGKTAELGVAKTRAKLDAGQQALQLVATIQGTVNSYSAELERLRASRWAAENVLAELHGQAIAARVLVHDLERRFNLPLTVFEELPGLPAPSPASEAQGHVHA